MSLFTKLLRLAPTAKEDFHSEIVAHVLNEQPELTFAWLRSFQATALSEFDEMFVSSQEVLAPLDVHQGVGSRPDIAIRIVHGSQTELVFVESKIGSTENPWQLRKYAQHLATQNATHRCLLFLTRDYEPKIAPNVARVRFVQRRWADFYRFFKQQQTTDGITSELLKFMEEQNMSQSNQFSPIDLIALTNFTKARKLMDQTMWQSVVLKFRRICGSKFSYPSDASLQLLKLTRYVMYSAQGKGLQMLVTLGYWIDDTSIVNSPTVAVRLFVNPKSAHRTHAVTSMKAFLEARPEWSAGDLTDVKTWSYITAERSLQSFVADVAGDHVKAVTAFFEQSLEELNEFIAANRHLPWNPDVLSGKIGAGESLVSADSTESQVD